MDIKIYFKYDYDLTESQPYMFLFRFSWRYQLREFKSEFRVVAVDMRGYGESDLPLSTENYQLDHLVTDVKDIVEYLGKKRLPVISSRQAGRCCDCVSGQI